MGQGYHSLRETVDSAQWALVELPGETGRESYRAYKSNKRELTGATHKPWPVL